jgi:hypothetical protein
VTINLTNEEIGTVLIALLSGENAIRYDIRKGWVGKQRGEKDADRLKVIRESIREQRREQRDPAKGMDE